MTLTKDEREACLDAMEKLRPRTSTDGSHPRRFATPDEIAAGWRAHDQALLDAVRPLIERAVLLRAVEVARECVLQDEINSGDAASGGAEMVVARLSALADEVRG